MKHEEAQLGRRGHPAMAGIPIWLLYLIPCLGTAFFIARFGVNVPVNDDWIFADIFRMIREGGHGFGDLFWPAHLEHRMAVPKLIMTGLAYASNFNVKLTMFVSLAFVLTTYVAIARSVRQDNKQNNTTTHVLVVVVGALLFSLVHYETWLLGFGLAFVSVACFTLGAILVLSRSQWSPPVRLALTAAFCLLASFSAGQGLLSWIVVLPSVYFAFEKRRSIWACSAVLALFVLTCLLYRVNYHPPEWHGHPGWSSKHPLQVIVFAFALLGAPFCQGMWAWEAAPWVGGLICVGFLLLTLVAIQRRCVARVAPWFSIGLFGLGCAALIAFGRAPFGIYAANLSRYMIFSICVPMGALLMFHSLAVSPSWRWIFVVVAGEMVFLHLGAFEKILHAGQVVKAQRSDAALFLEVENYIDKRTDQDERSLLYPLYTVPGNTGYVRQPAKTLGELGILKIQQQVAFQEGSEFCGCLDRPGQDAPAPLQGPGTNLYVSGWAILPERVLPNIVLISAGNERVFIGGARVGAVERPEAALRMNAPALRQCGWQTLIPAGLLPDEPVELKAWAYDADKHRFLRLANCDGP